MLKNNFFLLVFLFYGISVYAQPTTERTPDEVYANYEKAFLSQNVEELLDLYAQDAVVISFDGNSYKGTDDIRNIYERAFPNLPPQLAFETLYHITEGKALYRVYAMKNKETGEQFAPFVTDTFIIEDGKIQFHTFAEYYPGMEIVEAPVPLKAPEGWNPQISSLPRYFAPNLYEGIADYAFAPGMFDPNGEDYFTYAMVLWLPDGTGVNRQRLEEDLETYFDGLALAANPNRNWEKADEMVPLFFDSLATKQSVPQDSLRAKVELTPVPGEEKWEKSFNGRLRIYEPMAAKAPVALNAKVRLQRCPASDMQVVFVEISPRPYSHRLWQQLDEMARQWHCPEE